MSLTGAGADASFTAFVRERSNRLHDAQLRAGAVSKYRVVERAYPNALFVVEADGSPSPGIQPQGADYKTPRESDLLAPGRYTYVIALDGAGRWGLRLEVDR